MPIERNIMQSQRMVESRMRLGCRDAMEFYKKYSDEGQLFSYPKYQKHESGERPLNDKSARCYASIFEVDWHWLLTGEVVPDNTISLEIVDAVACCGDGVVNFDRQHVLGHHMISVEAFKQQTHVSPNFIKILKVTGDSMEPTISHGDFIWVDISCKSPIGDGVYLFCIGKMLVVKRVQIHPFTGQLKIISDNSKYLPVEAGPYDSVNIVGRVISYTKMIG